MMLKTFKLDIKDNVPFLNTASLLFERIIKRPDVVSEKIKLNTNIEVSIKSI